MGEHGKGKTDKKPGRLEQARDQERICKCPTTEDIYR